MKPKIVLYIVLHQQHRFQRGGPFRSALEALEHLGPLAHGESLFVKCGQPDEPLNTSTHQPPQFTFTGKSESGLDYVASFDLDAGGHILLRSVRIEGIEMVSDITLTFREFLTRAAEHYLETRH